MAIPKKWLNWAIEQRRNADLRKSGFSHLMLPWRADGSFILPRKFINFDEFPSKVEPDVQKALYSFILARPMPPGKSRLVKKMAKKMGKKVVDLKMPKSWPTPKSWYGIPFKK